MLPFSNFFNNLRMHNDKKMVASPHQQQIAKMRGGRDNAINQTTDASTHTHYHSPPPQVPEIFVALYGDGSMRRFRGHIKNNSAQMLSIDTVKICDQETHIDQVVSGTGALGIDDLNFPVALFSEHRDYIPVAVTYHTLEGRKSKYSISGIQTGRVAGGYNVEFQEPPTLQSLDA